MSNYLQVNSHTLDALIKNNDIRKIMVVGLLQPPYENPTVTVL
jgi:hypothetical protein